MVILMSVCSVLCILYGGGFVRVGDIVEFGMRLVDLRFVFFWFLFSICVEVFCCVWFGGWVDDGVVLLVVGGIEGWWMVEGVCLVDMDGDGEECDVIMVLFVCMFGGMGCFVLVVIDIVEVVVIVGVIWMGELLFVGSGVREGDLLFRGCFFV